MATSAVLNASAIAWNYFVHFIAVVLIVYIGLFRHVLLALTSIGRASTVSSAASAFALFVITTAVLVLWIVVPVTAFLSIRRDRRGGYAAYLAVPIVLWAMVYKFIH